MLQLYTQFYRETGVRRFNELISPRLQIFKGFPRNSMLHHFTQDDEMFPDASKPYFQGYSKRLPLELVYHSDLMEGHPRTLPFVPQRFILPFIKKHNLFRYIPRASDIQIDERTMIVVDYNPLKFTYRYVHTPISEYQKWESYQKTFWSHIGALALKSNRQHFVLLDPIINIPSYNMLLNYSDKEGMTLARLFNTHEKRLILHLSNFIKDELRDRSVFNLIPIEALKKINMVFMLADGRCSTLNLSYFYSWIKGDENVSTIKVSLQRDRKIMVRALLKYLLVISSAIPEDAAETIPQTEETVEEIEDHNDEHDYIDEGPIESFQQKNITPPIEKKFQEPLKSIDAIDELSDNIIQNLNDDMEILEQKNRFDLHKRGISLKDNEVVEVHPTTVYNHEDIHEEVHTALIPNNALKKKMVEALEDGTLNAASYKKALQDADAYIKMLDPYGSGNLTAQKTEIHPEQLIIHSSETQLADHPTIIDKSMTQSTLQSYTRDYIDEHMKNDVIKMVGGLQKGGVIIQKHEITQEHTVMGNVEIHNLQLKPINGTASSIWFKLPVVEHDGSFKVAGNRYMLRKNRADLPIRKISPNEVSLNSYYGKAFVSSESKIANSTSDWILKQINKASFEGSEWIKDVVPGNTFDSYAKIPYIFGLLSTSFVSFKAGGFSLMCDNGKNIRMSSPREGMRWCGHAPDNGLLWVDMNNDFYILKEGKLELFGDIFKVLNLDPHNSPIRFSELAIFRKNVPVGVILGYRLGWSKLLALLEVKPRFVEPKKRLNLTPDEYPIPFNDGVYIFSRKNHFATMILAGFLDYAKMTKSASVKDFEHQDIYMNLLTSKGLGAIYLREIDMLFDYFIDPITEEILKDMNEPVTFDGLLLKATEMLMSYQHPKEYDGSYTRIRGYERFSGAVYKEMTAAIRQFRSKNIAGRSKIDISPYKVWSAINSDPTVMLVPEINPIQDIKNDESVTYVGEGGRSSDGMNKASRSFHVQDVGVISEGTVDSSDVGVNIYTSSDPHLRNHRGLKNHDAEVQNANRHCSAVLLAAGAMHDD